MLKKSLRKPAIASFALFLFSFSSFSSEAGLPPLFDYEEDIGLKGKDTELRMLAPICEFSSDETSSHNLNAIRPLLSWEGDKSSYAFDVLWPLFAYRENNFEKYWRFILLYSGQKKFEDDPGKPGDSPHTGFIPLFFYGDDTNGDFYWSVFPVYGEVRDFLSYDSIYFILFPVYLKTKKGNAEGESYLWPILNWDESPKYKKFRFIPFYAYHERPDSFRRASYLWPFYHTAEYYSAKNGGSGWLLWPLVGKNKFQRLESWSFLWPFFSTHKRLPDEKGEDDGFGFTAPWPVLQYKRNVDRDEDNEEWKFYLWPIYGRSERKDSEYQFIMWPFGSSLHTFGDQGNVEWAWALPLYWSKHGADKNGKISEVYRHFWPFASYLSKADDFSEIRVLDIWIQRNMPAVDRNWTPLWTLFDYQRNGEAFRYDFLWGWIKYSDNRKEGESFSVFPFYNCEYDMRNVGSAVAEGEEKNAGVAAADTVVRDYFMGFVQTTNKGDSSSSLRLFWLVDFDF
jgi:hypothetical protein